MIVFWPDDILRKGWAYGWRFDGSQPICVAGVLHDDQVWRFEICLARALRVLEAQYNRMTLGQLAQRLEEISRSYPLFGSPTVIGYVYLNPIKPIVYREIRLFSPITKQLDENL
jgi:hypothetical protein